MDVIVTHHGSVVLVRPVTQAAQDWLDDHTGQDALWFGGAIAVEPRYIDGLLDGLSLDGLEIG